MTAPSFSKGFDSYACHGDSIETEHDGIVYRAVIEHDADTRIDDDDCHNVDPKVTGCNPKQQRKLLAARQAWFDDEWFYCGITIEAVKNGITLDDSSASLWGIECNYSGSENGHLLEVANQLLPDAIEAATAALKSLCDCQS